MSTETIEPLPIQTIDTISAVHSSGQREPVFNIQEVVDQNDPEGEHYFVLTGASDDPKEEHVYGLINFEETETGVPHMHLEAQANVRDPRLLGCFVTAAVERIGARLTEIRPESDTNGIPKSVLVAAGFMGKVGTQNQILTFHR